MGFWDSVGTLAKGAVNSINEYNAEFQARKEKMEAKSNDELWRIVKDDGGFFGASQDDKKMAYYVLKQRGEVQCLVLLNYHILVLKLVAIAASVVATAAIAGALAPTVAATLGKAGVLGTAISSLNGEDLASASLAKLGGSYGNGWQLQQQKSIN